jgi:glycosyltransferase involved in cell wall biosynthesis
MSATASIILCSHNRADHLEKTLQSLRQVAIPEDWSVELLLVDNASMDATPEVMQAFNHPRMDVRRIREEKTGLSNARNRGLQEARGEVLLFTDDDVRVPSGWIEGMVTPILRDEADAVAGGVELCREVQAQGTTPRHRSLLASTEQIDSSRPDRLVGANMAVARKVFDEVPKFDPELGPGQLGLGGDTLFSWQMREAGFRIETAFDVVVQHFPDLSRLTWEEWEETAKDAGRSGAYRSYHWEHRHYSLPALLAGWVYYTVRVWWKETVGATEKSGTGMAIKEVLLRRRKHRIRQHLREYGSSPKYEKRGLVKKNE